MNKDSRRPRAIAIAATEAETRIAWLRMGLLTGLAIATVSLIVRLAA